MVEFLFQVVSQLVRLMAELGGHLAHLNLIDSVLRDIVDDLVHLNEELRSYGQLTDHFLFHPDIVAFMVAKQRTR